MKKFVLVLVCVAACVFAVTKVSALAAPAAATKFQDCAKGCCKKVGELGGKSNGGEIGKQTIK